MTDKYRVHEIVRFNYSDIGEYIDENHTDRPLRNDILVELLNKLNDENAELYIQLDFLKDKNRHIRDLVNENEQLKKENKELKQQLSDIDKLINDLGSEEMCRQYDEIIGDME